ncbi:hypothetical protein [Parachlamydia sp. AcF125]|uniref:hypothetical protein n=1 Tax=Parachlamydia sp. AcF125 TaxID=2795736 RepID=UPI001BD84768|nr:hypothetical protein [Parachlamydia sp. AcF125]MBS4169107.1 hypothetical protein [Parachlamydia sp. AcF125]
MHRFWGVLVGLMTFFSSGHALVDLDYKIGAGYRQDRFEWSISDPQSDPSVSSKLAWEDLYSYNVMGNFKVSICSLTARLKGNYGSIYHGKNQDSDYLEGEQKQECLRLISDAGKGEVFDLSAAIGFQTTWFCSLLKIIPLVGWSHHELHLRQFDGNQTVNLFGDLGKISNLHSNYRAKWEGPWTGVDTFCYLGPWTLYGTLEYHWAHFNGKGHWNLRWDFLKDFKQGAHANGTFITLGTQYQFKWGGLIGLEGQYVHMKTWHGLDYIYSIYYGNTSLPFNGATWQSYRILGTLSYMF